MEAGKLIIRNTRDKSLKVVQHKTAIIIVTIKEERVFKAKCSLKEDYTTSYERKHPLFISLHFSRHFKVTDVRAVIITSPITGFLLINRYKNIVLYIPHFKSFQETAGIHFDSFFYYIQAVHLTLR